MAFQLPLLMGLAAGSAVYTEWRRISRLEVRRMPKGGISTYRGGRYCGPGWGWSFVRKDVESGKIAHMPEAIDVIDDACRRHDQCYDDNGWFFRDCNVRLARELVEIVRAPTNTAQQRMDAAVMAAVFAVEADGIDPWLRPAVDLASAVRLRLCAAVDSLFQGTTTMLWVIEQEIYRINGVPRYGLPDANR